MNQPLHSTVIWNNSNIHQALVLLGQSSQAIFLEPYETSLASSSFEDWLLQAGERTSLELTTITVKYAGLVELIRANAPLILPIPSHTENIVYGYMVILRGGVNHCTLLGVDGKRKRLPLERLLEVIREPLQRTFFESVSSVLQKANIPLVRRKSVRTAYLDVQLADHLIEPIWLIKNQAHSSKPTHNAITRWLGLQVGLRSGHYILFFTAVALMGQASVTGRIQPFWLILGLLVWVSRIPLALLLVWLEHVYALKLGLGIKQQLFQHTLRLPLQRVLEHSTRYFHDVMETETLEESGLQRSSWVIASGVFLLLALLVLLIMGDFFGALILAIWLTVCTAIIWRLFKQYTTFITQHKDLMNQFVEQLRGHTTRLIQETNWFKREDTLLAQYLQQAKLYDQRATVTWTLIPYGGVLIALLGIAPLALDPPSLTVFGISLRLSLWLFVIMQLQILAFSIPELMKSLHAWHQIQQLQTLSSAIEPTNTTDAINRHEVILELRNVRYRFTENLEPILNNVNLTVKHGETIWLQGATGSGKSTLATIMCHLRQPTSGVLLYAGNDQYTLNPRIWRKHIAFVSSSAQNHLLNGSLAYNLLMGRNRVPTSDDLTEATTLCQHLGLGELLKEMPYGIQQYVGENGWRLSHGERNRVFIARAILQNPDLIIIDENLVALDPENKVHVLETLIKYSNALIVIDSE